ncbi:MAG TPA: hypothetical protein VF310_02340 [Vicinamibacteria bacterium]
MLGEVLPAVQRLLADTARQQGNIAGAIALLADPDAMAPLTASGRAAPAGASGRPARTSAAA